MTCIGVAFDGMSTVAAAVRTARRAERHGVGSMWIAEHLGYRESMVTAMGVLAGTRTLRAIPTAVSPYLRHPMLLAMGAATLTEHGAGRVAIALGVGNPLFLEESGVTPSQPITWLREYLACLRLLLSGQPAHHAGEIFTLTGAQLSHGTPFTIPIYVAAMGPQMLRLAGRTADGVVLSSGLSPQATALALEVVREAAGTDRGTTHVRAAGYVITSISRNGRTAIEACRTKLAFVLRNKHISESVRASGIPVDQEAIIAAIGRRDLEAACRLVPDDAVEAFTIAGTPDDCRGKLAAYVDAGLDEVVLSLTGPETTHGLALALAREVGSPA